LQKTGLIAKKYLKARCGGFSKKNRPRRGNDSRCNEILKEEFDS
jgi:hypothetical protein